MSDQIIDIIDVGIPGETGDVTPEALQVLSDTEGVRDQAITARNESRSARDEAEGWRDQAEVFSATSVELQDAAVAALVATPGGETRTQLNATFVTVNEAPLDVRRYGATLDGITDDTDALRAAIAALPPSGGELLVHGGTALTKPLSIVNKSRMTIRFDRGQLKASPVSEGVATDVGVALTINGCTDVDVVGALIDGNKANITDTGTHGTQVAVRVTNSNRVHLESPTVFNAVHDGIGGSGNTDLKITTPTIKDSGQHGIYFSTTVGLLIEGGFWSGIGGAAIRTKIDCERITVIGGTIHGATMAFSFTGGAQDVNVIGIHGTDIERPWVIDDEGGTGSRNNKRIRLSGVTLIAPSAGPGLDPSVQASVCEDLSILDSHIEGFRHVGGFHSIMGSRFKSMIPGASGLACVHMPAKGRFIGNYVQTDLGRGVELQGPDALVADNTFEVSDSWLRILASATNSRRSGNRIIAGSGVFDSSASGASLTSVIGKAAVSATTPGAVARKIEVFDEQGTSLGFVPVYAAIT